MAKKNDGMRGEWNKSGLFWNCDCPGASGRPLLKVGMGQGGLLSMKPNAPSKYYCTRCQMYRPLKKDRPDLPLEKDRPDLPEARPVIQHI